MDWVWQNRDSVLKKLGELWKWLRGTKEEGKHGVLILEAGGVGKTTLGRILSGNFDVIFDLSGEYDESLDVETYTLKESAGVEVVVPPGQEHRREATWSSLLAELAAGKYRGVVLINSYGYHNHGIGPTMSYKSHALYRGNKDDFLQQFLEERRREELSVLRNLTSSINSASTRPLWFLTLVTKQDPWWNERSEVNDFYSSGEYDEEIQKVQNRLGVRGFRHEFTPASLVIGNFATGMGEILKTNTAGSGHAEQADSLRRMFVVLDSLMKWEEGA